MCVVKVKLQAKFMKINNEEVEQGAVSCVEVYKELNSSFLIVSFFQVDLIKNGRDESNATSKRPLFGPH